MKETTKTQKLICGVGINDLYGQNTQNGSKLKSYNTWKDMLARCYSEKCQAKKPTYVGCSVCDEWLILSNFKKWHDINYRENMALDKDILIPGNKIYSPEACSFVPQYINSLLTDAGAARGDLPLGVVAQKPSPKTNRVNTTYTALCSNGNGKLFRKTFKTVPEAAAWYVTTKKRVVKEQAIRAFEAGDITDDVYQALITREWGEEEPKEEDLI